MKPELEQKLFESYPKIFQQKDLPPTQSLMCFGFECGDGWYAIIDALCATLQAIADNTDCQPVAVQVKQKWGELRFYADGINDEAYGAISMAEAMSRQTCENCGSTEGVASTKGWITQLCKRCKDEKDQQKRSA